MSNLLPRIEPIATELETIAADLDAAGIGGDLTRGHAVTLRAMASSLRADASKGRTSYAFDQISGAANPATTPESKRHLRMQAAIANPAMSATVKYAVGQLKKLSMDLHAASDVAALNKAMTDRGMNTVERISLKMALHRIGCLDD